MVKPESLKLGEFVSNLKKGDTERAAVYLQSLMLSGDVMLSEKSWSIIEKAIEIYQFNEISKDDLLDNRSNRQDWRGLNEKILGSKKLKVLFLNDIGFNAGAGIGVHRQVQSFLNNGDDVSLIAFHDKPNSNKYDLKQYKGDLVDCIDLTKILVKGKLTDIGLKRILGSVVEQKPDLIISGNFHARSLPAKVLQKISDLDFPVVAYAHDCDWITGGCAHFLYHGCEQYLTGCSSHNCPKIPGSYPPTKIEDISTNWLDRENTFTGKNNVPMAVNSEWVKKEFRKRFKEKAMIGKVTLGLNTKVYKPRDKIDAKKRLGISSEISVILVGSGFFGTRGKGNELLESLFSRLASHKNIIFGLIGNTDKVAFPSNVKHLGYVYDDESLAWIYAAADIFVNPVTVEAFGQTMLEALACACPVVSLNECGVGEISVDGLTAIHCEDNISSISEAILGLLGDKKLRVRLQDNGRYLVEHYFSLEAQYNNWRQFLIKTSYKKMREKTFLIDRNNSRKKLLVESTKPLLSVVTVTYNVGEEFYNTANSIISQSSLDFEWVVIDGKSGDDSLKIINEYDDYIDTFISEPDRGIYDAMNKSVKHAKGEYVIFLGSGDTFASESVIEEFAKRLDSNIDVLYGNVFELRQDGNVLPTSVIDFDVKWKSLKKAEFPIEPIMRGLPPHQATFMKRELIEKYKFDLDFTISADWDLIFKLYSLDYNFQKVDFTFAWYPNGGYSAVHSVQWLKDVRFILHKYVTDKIGLNKYFDKVVSNQKRVVDKRSEQELIKEKYLNWLSNGYSHQI